MNPLLIGPLADLLNKGLDRWFPDPEKKAQAQLELLKLQQEGAFKELEAELQINLAQAKINEMEAAQSDFFRGGGRPAAMWVCVLGMFYEFLVRPLLPWTLVVFGVPGVPELPTLDAVLFELLLGMLGLGAMREAGRWKRMAALSKQ